MSFGTGVSVPGVGVPDATVGGAFHTTTKSPA